MAFWVKLTAAMPDMWSSKRAETVGAPTLFASAVAPREGACKNGFAARACASSRMSEGKGRADENHGDHQKRCGEKTVPM